MPQTIRIKPETRAKLADIAQAESTTLTKMLDKVVDAYRRRQFLIGANADFAALRRNPKRWKQEEQERRQWDQTLADGLADEVE